MKKNNVTYMTVSLRKAAKNECGKCGKKIKVKELSDCTFCGKTFCNKCAGWTIFFKEKKPYFACAECAASHKEAHND